LQLDQNAQSLLRRNNHRNSPFPQVAAHRNSKKNNQKWGNSAWFGCDPMARGTSGLKTRWGTGIINSTFSFEKNPKNPGALSFVLAFSPSVARGGEYLTMT